MTELRPPSPIALLRALIDEVSLLFRQELRLAQAEAGEKLARLKNGLAAFAAALLLGTAGLVILLQALVLALEETMPAWAAALVVGGGTALLAVALAAYGRACLDVDRLKPERTLRAMRKDKELVMEKVR